MKFSDYTTDAMALFAAIKRGDLSAREVTNTAIEAAAQMNEWQNAVVMANCDNARLGASDKLPDTPVTGSPLLLKDVNHFNFDVPTTYPCRF